MTSNTLDFYNIPLQWHGFRPADLAQVEQMVRDDLLRNVLPIKPADLESHYIVLPPAIVFVCGKAGSDQFHCVYLF